MIIGHITLEQLAARGSQLCESPAALPADLTSSTPQLDVETPFRNGKAWTFELMRLTQPLTWAALSAGSSFWLERFARPTFENRALVLEVNGMVVEVCCSLPGSNPSDPGHEQEMEEWRYLTKREGNPTYFKPRVLSVPEPLRLAYYTRINGLNLPSEVPGGMESRLLPRPTFNWLSVDIYLQQLRLKKRYLPLVDEMIPGVRPPKKGDLYTNFMMFLDARPQMWGKGDVFFVKNHIQDGIVYYVRDGDIPNMSILTDAAAAIDRYCAHVLTGTDVPFDFMPYAVPFAQT